MNYGNCNAGSTTSVIPILVWNNQNGGQTVPDAVSCNITTVTFNGLISGDTIPNGQELVTNQYFQVQCLSQGDTGYTPVGGNTTHTISTSAGNLGDIPGTIGGGFAYVNTQIAAISTVTAGPVAFLIRCNYLYA